MHKLVQLAQLGPTGAKRDCASLWKRLKEEAKELYQAHMRLRGPREREVVGADMSKLALDVLTEAADVYYYSLLLQHNSCKHESELGYNVLAATTEALNVLGFGPYYTPKGDREKLLEIIEQCAVAKYETRFVKNKRVKNHQAERKAILNVLVNTFYA